MSTTTLQLTVSCYVPEGFAAANDSNRLLICAHGSSVEVEVVAAVMKEEEVVLWAEPTEATSRIPQTGDNSILKARADVQENGGSVVIGKAECLL